MKFWAVGVIVALCALACGTEIGCVDPQIRPYVDNFQVETGVEVKRISVQFGTLEYPVIGQCDGLWSVTIDPEYWKQASDDARTVLVYHELGHCAMKLEHINDLRPDGCPMSLMFFQTLGGSECWRRLRGYYIDELRSHAQENP